MSARSPAGPIHPSRSTSPQGDDERQDSGSGVEGTGARGLLNARCLLSSSRLSTSEHLPITLSARLAYIPREGVAEPIAGPFPPHPDRASAIRPLPCGER